MLLIADARILAWFIILATSVLKRDMRAMLSTREDMGNSSQLNLNRLAAAIQVPL